MKDQDIALAILVVVVVVVVIIAMWYFLIRGRANEPRYKNRRENAEGDPDDITSLEEKKKKLREHVDEISDEEDAVRDREVANLKNQINLLNLQSGIQNEQTKYLTANVNRTIYPA